jgi:hypothetical protein
MGATNRITRAVSFLRNLKTKKNMINISVDDLINPRFGINTTNANDLNKVPNSLQFLMYSKENDTLFI